MGLAEWGLVGLYRVLQQRSTPKIIFSSAKDVAKLSIEVVYLLLLERQETLW